MNAITSVYVLAASILVAIVPLACTAVLYISDEQLKTWMPRLIAVAVGVLLGDAFLHLLPDALEETGTGSGSVFLATLGGIFCFYYIEQVLHWRHDHNVEGLHAAENEPATYAHMNLLGDGVHNFVDGILIASSFLVDPTLGVTTTIAIVIHEIPQEISDIAVLIQGGFNKRTAIFLNFLCATACIVGAVATLLLSQLMELSLGILLAFTAGGFIYIATCDLVPLLRSKELNVGLPTQITASLIGVLSMQSILWIENIG